MRPWIPNFTHYRIIIEEGKISGNNGEITTANLGSKYHTFETQVQVHIFCCGMFCKPKFESELIRCRNDWNVRYSWTGWPLVTMLELYTMGMCTSVIHQSIIILFGKNLFCHYLPENTIISKSCHAWYISICLN